MNYALAMYVSQCASELGNPEANGIFSERLARNVESQVSPSHEINDEIHIFNVLKAISEIADEGMVDMLKHSSFSYDVANALGSNN